MNNEQLTEMLRYHIWTVKAIYSVYDLYALLNRLCLDSIHNIGTNSARKFVHRMGYKIKQ